MIRESFTTKGGVKGMTTETELKGLSQVKKGKKWSKNGLYLNVIGLWC